MKRLFYCRTPLQTLVVRAIQDRHPEDDYILYYPTSGSIKHRIYFDRLHSSKALFIDYTAPSFSQLATEIIVFLRIQRWLKNLQIDQIAVASIGGMLFSMMDLTLCKPTVVTFDDGALSIDRDVFSYMYEGDRRYEFLRRVIGARINRELIDGALRHYTIFEPNLSLFPKAAICLVALFGDRRPTAKRGPGLGELSILLGSAPQLMASQAASNYHRFMREHAFDVFIPHPATDVKPTVSRAETELAYLKDIIDVWIAEDIVMYLVSQGYTITVYGFGSTALLNLSQVASTVNIVIPYCNEGTAEAFSRVVHKTVSFGFDGGKEVLWGGTRA